MENSQTVNLMGKANIVIYKLEDIITVFGKMEKDTELDLKL
jgi:hypothetical protein